MTNGGLVSFEMACSQCSQPLGLNSMASGFGTTPQMNVIAKKSTGGVKHKNHLLMDMGCWIQVRDRIYMVLARSDLYLGYREH